MKGDKAGRFVRFILAKSAASVYAPSMTFARHDPIDTLDRIAKKPSWITSVRDETLEDVAFLSGAALSHLHVVLGHHAVPQALLRERLALPAAEAWDIADTHVHIPWDEVTMQSGIQQMEVPVTENTVVKVPWRMNKSRTLAPLTS